MSPSDARTPERTKPHVRPEPESLNLAGQVATFQPASRAVGRPTRSGHNGNAGDAGYGGLARELLSELGVTPVIPPKTNEKDRATRFARKTYRQRNVIDAAVRKWARSHVNPSHPS